MAFGVREAGARVAVTGRDSEKNAAVAAELGEDAVFGLDVRDGDSVAATVTAVAERFGGLHILVNNAGLFRGGPLLGMKREDWQAVIDPHLPGSFPFPQPPPPPMPPPPPRPPLTNTPPI